MAWMLEMIAPLDRDAMPVALTRAPALFSKLGLERPAATSADSENQ